MSKKNIKIRNLGLRHIHNVCLAMHNFTINRKKTTPDEIWLMQHYPVFTVGVNQTKKDFIIPNDIPIIFNDRGGKITYHGPGQLMVYVLMDLIRKGLSVCALVSLMQNTIISTLKCFSIHSYVIKKFPGVYVDNQKICSLGLRIKNGCSFHGMALNINMNLIPFKYINPCGNNFKMTQVTDILPNLSFNVIQLVLIDIIKKNFS